MNILLWLAYKGTNYSGFQVQPNGVTVCAVVQDAMQSVFGTRPDVKGCSRTALLACYPFFIYQLIQFMRGIPRDLDESACIDGCGTFRIFWQILLPLMKPALFSAGLFQFLWTYNDYFNSLIFINSVKKYTISLALRLSVDAESVVVWGRVMAMACVAVLPLVLLFFAAQKYFVEGIATSGLKG